MEQRKLPGSDVAKHAFYGTQINENFCVKAIGDTLMNRGVEWTLFHYPNGITGNEDDGFGGEYMKDFHQSEIYSTYRQAVKAAKENDCSECELEGDSK